MMKRFSLPCLNSCMALERVVRQERRTRQIVVDAVALGAPRRIAEVIDGEQLYCNLRSGEDGCAFESCFGGYEVACCFGLHYSIFLFFTGCAIQPPGLARTDGRTQST